MITPPFSVTPLEGEAKVPDGYNVMNGKNIVLVPHLTYSEAEWIAKTLNGATNVEAAVSENE